MISAVWGAARAVVLRHFLCWLAGSRLAAGPRRCVAGRWFGMLQVLHAGSGGRWALFTSSGGVSLTLACVSGAQNSDTQGCVTEKQLRWADGFILVYSICDRASFSVVSQQVRRIRQAKKHAGGADKVPIIIVGNKRDLQHRRTVSSEEGRMLALSADCGFFEISAAETYHGVLLVFHELLELIRESRATRKGIKGIVRSMSAVFGRRRID